MKVRLENKLNGSDKYWEFCTIRNTDLCLVVWGPNGTSRNQPRINGRQIIKIDDAKRKRKQKISKGYTTVYEGKEVIKKIIVLKNTPYILIFNDGTDAKLTSEVEARFDPTDIEQISNFDLEDSVTFILPANNKRALKMVVNGRLLDFLET